MRRIVNIAPGEGRLVAALGALMLATAAGGALGATASEALLFANFDLAQLPLLYVALGATTFACTLVASALLAGGDRARLYVILPLVLAAAVGVERMLAATGLPWSYAVIWLGMNVVTTLQGIGAWGIAGAVCDVRQAKRVFPLLNAAKIAGTVVGSVAVTVTVRAVAVADFLVIWGVTLVVAALIAFALRRRLPRSVEPSEAHGLIDEMRRGFEVVRASSLLRLLAVALVVFSLLYFSLALPFSRGARATYADAAELAAFLGLFNGATTIVALLASLFVANRLYARIGIVNAIVGLGAVYLAGFAAIAVSGAFAVLVAARFAQTVWLSGIADTAYQALFNPVPPERRDQIRAFMEGVPGQAGIALAGVVLLVGDTIDPRALALAGIVASLATVGLLWRTRPAYGRALADALRAGWPQAFLPDDDPFGALRTDADALRVTLEGLRSSDASVRRVSAAILRDLALVSTVPALITALYDDDTEVRTSAVAALAALGVTEPLAPLARDGDPSIRVRVAVATGNSDLVLLARDGDVEVRRAVAAVISELADAPMDLLFALIRDEDDVVRRLAVDRLARARLHESNVDETLLVSLLEDPDTAVADAAVRALAALGTTAARAHLAERAREAVADARRDVESVRRLGAPADEVRALVVDAIRERALAPARRAVVAALALAGRERVALIFEWLESPSRDTRASAVELLEAQGGDLLRTLMPLWEKTTRVEPTADDVLHALSTSDPDELVRDAARRAIFGGDAVETMPTISMVERVLFLRKVSLFGTLSPGDLKQVATLAHEELHADGAVLAREGDAGDRMYVIVAGSVRVVVGADQRVIARRGAGEAIGEMAVVTAHPRIAGLVCEGDVRVLAIARREFEAILRDRPQVALAIIRVLSARLSELQTAA